MKMFLLATALAATAISATSAQSQGDDPIKPFIEAGFAGMDKNKDGNIDRGEFETAMRARLAKQSSQVDGVMTELDKDQDRRISPAEAQANAEFAKAFKPLDQNSDGYLSRDEVCAALIAAHAF